MKIIGKTKEGFLLEAETEEVYRLVGFYGKCAAGERKVVLGIGDDIRVHSMYEQLYRLRSRSEVLSRASADLRNAADLLEAVNPVVRSITEETL